MSQCTEVMAGPRLLAQDLAASVAAHLPVAAPVPVPVPTVGARHQASQEALGPAGQTLPAARPGVTVSPAGAHTVTPGSPYGRLQQLIGAVVQGGRQLHEEAVEHGGTGLGLWGEKGGQVLGRSLAVHTG